MEATILNVGRLADAAVGALIVLSAGSLAVRFCSEPVRRVRLILLTLLGAVVVPALGASSLAPRWSAPVLPAPASIQDHARPAPAIVEREEIAEADPAPAIPSRPQIPGVERVAGRSPAAEAPADTIPAARPTAWGRPSASVLCLSAHAVISAGLLGWWLIGQGVLWRISRSARPASEETRALLLGLAGPAGARVRLLESDRVALPFTYTWRRPVIVLPVALARPEEREALRYVLAHEWSHVERGDAHAWSFAGLAGLLLFYQPLYWWLRRQLRLGQDHLADARAAASGIPEDYAALLVRLARTRRSHSLMPALGVVDRRSQLGRRVVMLLQDRGPLESRCRPAWSLAVGLIAAVLVTAASGLRLAAAPLGDEPPKKEETPAAKAEPPKPEAEALNYRGTVKDKDTGKPIAGATVVVRRSIYRDNSNRVLQETRHTTAADGTYAFTIPPEQVAQSYLYIELDVEHPDYATRANFGYSLGMIRKNEGLGERPFFELVELRPARPITGRIESPEGKPLEGVKLLAYSRTNTLPQGEFEYGSFARTQTDAEGKFRLPITTPGEGILWVLPKTHGPEMHVLGTDRRGDLGTLTLKNGVRVSGRVVDAEGKPLAGLFVEASRDRGAPGVSEALGRLMVADAITRTAKTDAEGRFTFDPLPPGSYRVSPTDHDPDANRSVGWVRTPLPAVFVKQKLTIADGEASPPMEVKAVPHVVIEGGWFDSKGQPKPGWSSFLWGQMDGEFWNAQTQLDDQGRFSEKVPRGLEQVQIDIMTNEHASAVHRIGKDMPLIAGRHIKFGKLDRDVKDIEIVRYVAPVIVINATRADGRQVEGFEATVEYTKPDPDADKNVYLSGGKRKKVAIQDEQNDGRYRTSQLLPDREVTVTAKAEGFTPTSRTMTLPEGKVEEITLVLQPK